MPTGSRRALLRPRWLALHLLVVVALCVMVRLGIWQWSVGEATGALRNYSYGLEWWAFAGLSLVGWIKFCLDETAPGAASPGGAATAAAGAAPTAGGGARAASGPDVRVVAAAVQPVPAQAPAPTVTPGPEPDADDPELAAWNARFAELARRDAEPSS